MKPVYICAIVFNRHDKLKEMMKSLQTSTVKPAGVYIVDHGYDEAKVRHWIRNTVDGDVPVHVITLEDPGVAHAANWCILNVPEERIHACDDVKFHPETIERLCTTEGDFITPTFNGRTAGFPLFLMRDSCVEKVGLFDETISPGYLYFEDWDYTHRMALAGIAITGVEAGFDHITNSSINAYTPRQMAEHHRKFVIAHDNYYRKWPELKPKEQVVGK